MSRNKELGTKLRLSTRTISHLPSPNHPTTPPTAAVKFSRIAEKFHSRVEDPFSLVPLRPNEVHKRTKIRFSLPYIIIRLSFPVRSPRFSVVSSPVASFARKENSRGQTHNGYLIFLFQKVSTSRVCGPLTERERERADLRRHSANSWRQPGPREKSVEIEGWLDRSRISVRHESFDRIPFVNAVAFRNDNNPRKVSPLGIQLSACTKSKTCRRSWPKNVICSELLEKQGFPSGVMQKFSILSISTSVSFLLSFLTNHSFLHCLTIRTKVKIISKRQNCEERRRKKKKNRTTRRNNRKKE